MNYQETTQVPNRLFDLIPQLKPSEVLILFIIIRQTLGWYDPKTKQRKLRDWISYQQFHKKTGLSIKTISTSIRHLISLGLVKATNNYGTVLSSSTERRGKVRIYYQCLFVDRQSNSESYVKNGMERRKKVPITKLTPTKLKRQKEKTKNPRRLSDSERLREILEQGKKP